MSRSAVPASSRSTTGADGQTRGRELRATVIAVADELAAGADLARAKDAMQPAIVVRGASRWVTDDDGPGVAPLLRDAEHDLFR